MANEAATGAGAGDGGLLTLTEVAKRTGISMPTLQKYKKQHADRIPSVGEGRKQRYPEEAVAVFQELREEGGSRRGRPARKSSGGKRKARAKKASGKRGKRAAGGKKGRAKASKASKAESAGDAGDKGLMTLTEVSKRTGISYPTLARYLKTAPERIPFEGKGRKRRYPPEALDAFLQMRSESSRGPRPAGKKSRARRAASTGRASSSGDMSKVTRLLERLEQRIASLEKEVKKPVKVKVVR